MAKQGEIDFLRNVGDDVIRYAIAKPFSDPACASYLMEIGAVLALLPPPPARLLDVGCGTGWTSQFFARRGYEVVGVDICPDMIVQAEQCRVREGLENLEFRVCDYEGMDYRNEFDCAVFYDSLHHAIDEVAALRSVQRALKPGGICIASEPGVGHADSQVSREAVDRYGVTERDMEPQRVIRAGREAGFRAFRVYPHAFDLGKTAYVHPGRVLGKLGLDTGWTRRLVGLLLLARLMLYKSGTNGIVTLTK